VFKGQRPICGRRQLAAGTSRSKAGGARAGEAVLRRGPEHYKQDLCWLEARLTENRRNATGS
jgi:hypothetical protein